MKKIVAIFLTFVICLSLCACNKKLFSKKLFKGDGIYQEFDTLSVSEREQFLSEAAAEGYTVGLDNEGRITLSKEGEKTLVLGESRKPAK